MDFRFAILVSYVPWQQQDRYSIEKPRFRVANDFCSHFYAGRASPPSPKPVARLSTEWDGGLAGYGPKIRKNCWVSWWPTRWRTKYYRKRQKDLVQNWACQRTGRGQIGCHTEDVGLVSSTPSQKNVQLWPAAANAIANNRWQVSQYRDIERETNLPRRRRKMTWAERE